MLYYLFRFLEEYGISGSHMWGYISFRSLLALILSLVISAWFGEKFIKYLKRKQITETARDASIDPFGVKKIGVPSMGGVIIIVSILVPVLLLGRLRNIYLILMIVTTLWLGVLGGMDDFIKIFRHDKEGLKGHYKIVGQVGIGLIVGLVLWASPDVKMNENLVYERQGQEIVVKHQSEAHKSLKTTIPFVKSHNLDYSRITSIFGEHRVAAGWILFVIMTIIVVTAVSNGANLNDGMDGMCAGNSAIIGVALGILAYVSSHIEYASYLNIMYIPESQELVVFLCAFVGALIGFLWYNAYPAQVFMGDRDNELSGEIEDGLPKSAVFISISNGDERARVFTGTGADKQAAWDDAYNEAHAFVEENSYDCLWVKADLMGEAKTLSSLEFPTELHHYRENFFRKGIAFDRNFDTALLEAELNGAKILDYDTECIRRMSCRRM